MLNLDKSILLFNLLILKQIKSKFFFVPVQTFSWAVKNYSAAAVAIKREYQNTQETLK